MHPMLTVQAPAGLLYLNGRFCGETGGSGLPLTRDGVVYLEYRPLATRGEGMAMRLDLKSGQVTGGLIEGAYAVQWPGGLIELELRGEGPAGEPTLHAQLDTPKGRLLLIEQDGLLSLGFGPEDETVLPVDGPVTQVALRTQPHPSMPLVAVSGQGNLGPFTTVFLLDHPPQLLQCVQGRPVEWAPDGTLRTTRPTPVDAARAWLDAVQTGSHDDAAQLLTQPALQSRLESEVGNFDQVVPLQPNLPGLAPVSWGLLSLVQPQIAQVRAMGFVLRPVEDVWRIEKVLPP